MLSIEQNRYVEFTKYLNDLIKIYYSNLINTWNLSKVTKTFGWIDYIVSSIT